MGAKELKQLQRKRPQWLEDGGEYAAVTDGRWINPRKLQNDWVTTCKRQLRENLRCLRALGLQQRAFQLAKVSLSRAKLIATMIKARSNHQEKR